ncbi:MAG: MerR family transcriptional regulator [Gammaproteobacteria bacterium]|nr:MerR family transcriptional regulator [Gammaproteobacteria bacterium]
MDKIYGTSGAARYAACSEETVRRADRVGIIRAERDSSGRRIFTQAEVEKLRAHIQKHRAMAAA